MGTESMNRAELIAFLKAHGRPANNSVKVDVLRERAAAVEAELAERELMVERDAVHAPDPFDEAEVFAGLPTGDAEGTTHPLAIVAATQPAVTVYPLPTALVADAVGDALLRCPAGTRSYVAERRLHLFDGEAEAVVRAITEHMREIVKADRSANMYREGKLRQVRTAILAGNPDVLPSAVKREPKAKADRKVGAKARVEALKAAMAEARAAKAAARQLDARPKATA
jgi:hypothetical protein